MLMTCYYRDEVPLSEQQRSYLLVLEALSALITT